jgi:hypothetical protein
MPRYLVFIQIIPLPPEHLSIFSAITPKPSLGAKPPGIAGITVGAS